jgi:hypothetical protein
MSWSSEIPPCQGALLANSRRLMAASVAAQAATREAIFQARATLKACSATWTRSQRHYERPVRHSVQTLLLSFPEQQGWTPAERMHVALLNDLLDAGSSLIEERIIETDGEDGFSWLVRLTQRGMLEREQCEIEQEFEDKRLRLVR